MSSTSQLVNASQLTGRSTDAILSLNLSVFIPSENILFTVVANLACTGLPSFSFSTTYSAKRSSKVLSVSVSGGFSTMDSTSVTDFLLTSPSCDPGRSTSGYCS